VAWTELILLCLSRRDIITPAGDEPELKIPPAPPKGTPNQEDALIPDRHPALKGPA
jgi:hypothetical protein